MQEFNRLVRVVFGVKSKELDHINTQLTYKAPCYVQRSSLKPLPDLTTCSVDLDGERLPRILVNGTKHAVEQLRPHTGVMLQPGLGPVSYGVTPRCSKLPVGSNPKRI
jgi:hypothetical protein